MKANLKRITFPQESITNSEVVTHKNRQGKLVSRHCRSYPRIRNICQLIHNG